MHRSATRRHRALMVVSWCICTSNKTFFPNQLQKQSPQCLLGTLSREVSLLTVVARVFVNITDLTEISKTVLLLASLRGRLQEWFLREVWVAVFPPDVVTCLLCITASRQHTVFIKQLGWDVTRHMERRILSPDFLFWALSYEWW